MAVTVRATTSLAYSSRDANSDWPKPDTALGDILLLEATFGINGRDAVIAPPSADWKSVPGYDTVTEGGGFHLRDFAWYKIVDGTESSTLSWVHEAGETYTSSGVMYALSGADIHAPIVPIPTVTSSTGQTGTAPGVTTQTDGSLLIYSASCFDSGTAASPPTGFTARYNPGGSQVMYVADMSQSAAGETGAVTAIFSGQGGSAPVAAHLLVVQADQSGNTGVLIRDSTSLTYGAHTDPAWIAPTILSGDFLLLLSVFGQSGSSDPEPTPPSGFTAVPGFPSTKTLGGFTAGLYAWSKVAGETEPDSYTWTGAYSSGGDLFALSGVDTSNPFSPAASINDGNQFSDGQNPLATGLTTLTPNSLVIYWVLGFGNAYAEFPPAGTTPTFTERYSNSADALYIADGRMVTPGATGNPTTHFSSQDMADFWKASLLVVRAAIPETPPETTGRRRRWFVF